MKIWHALEIEIARVAEAAVSAPLWAAGTTGIEFSEDGLETITLRAYFDEPPDPGRMREAIHQALALVALPPAALFRIEGLTIKDQDWLAEWKKGYEPIAIGHRLLVTPSWKRESVDAGDRVLIEIDPGMAFGTGTHETTRGCLELLEEHWRGGALLDVGTGTGILAIAALKLVPGSSVIGIDLDPEAIAVAEENAVINGVAEEITFEVNRLGSFERDFDLILGNLTADVLIPLAADFAAAIKPGGVLIISGILIEQGDEVREAFAAHGFGVIDRQADGEWVTFALRAPAA
jgi:ribosomal protein L11 methyltransferase